MHTRVRFLGPIVAVALAACSSSSTPPAGKVEVTFCSSAQNCTVSSIVNDGSTVTVTVLATDATGKAATGSAHISSLIGTINGKSADDVTFDATGAATALYACDVATIPSCSESATLVIATWNGLTGSGRLTLVTPALTDGGGGGSAGGSAGGSGGGSGGGTASNDAGTTVAPITETLQFLYVTPVSIGISAAASNGLPTSASVVFQVLGNGAPLAGATVDFAEAVGESLLTLSSTSGVSDSNGAVKLTVSATGTTGIGHVIASIPDSASTATAQIGIFGPPASVLEISEIPSLLGIHGSGIQEEGLMVFEVTDAYGTPVPGATVNFTVAFPQLVNLNVTSAKTDANGDVSIAYTSGAEVGVTTIVATAANSSIAGQHQVAVRGAKPSGAHFYFNCAPDELRVFDTVSGLATTTCHVELDDRFGNPVGISTPVNFATESGSIPSSAMTTPFDPNSANNSAEGTVDVTFTSDVTAGNLPVDVAPLAGEPSYTDSTGHVFNPRDNLVTVIAWTQGEEGFVDQNHNGAYDVGELFYDEGDPFIDANDNNKYDDNTGVAGAGQSEVRFCGDNANCSTYHGPNGVWDSSATIWTPAWVVFAGAPVPHGVPSNFYTPGAGPGPFTPSDCADYSDSQGVGHTAIIQHDVYFYDAWLNTPVAGSTYHQTDLISPLATSIGSDVTLEGFATEDSKLGAFGNSGLDNGYVYLPYNASGNPCTIADGTNCTFQLKFLGYDFGYRGTVFFANPALGTGKLGCAPEAGSGGPVADNGLNPVPFTVVLGVTTPDGASTDEGSVSGTFAPPIPATADAGP